MIFIIDSGSTKCDWIAIDTETGDLLFEKQRTKGLNPAIISDTDAFNIIKANDIIYGNKLKVTHVYFYGAGCGTEKPSKMLREVLESIFFTLCSGSLIYKMCVSQAKYYLYYLDLTPHFFLKER